MLYLRKADSRQLDNTDTLTINGDFSAAGCRNFGESLYNSSVATYLWIAHPVAWLIKAQLNGKKFQMGDFTVFDFKVGDYGFQHTAVGEQAAGVASGAFAIDFAQGGI